MRRIGTETIGLLLIATIAITISLTAQENITGMAPHGQYPDKFSATHDVIITNNQLQVSDTAVYKTAYYAINGSNEWMPFQLQGTELPAAEGWLTGATIYEMPAFGPGEHYIIAYTCTYNNDWDCHGGKWQLRIINNKPKPLEQTCDDNIQNQEETGIDCGGPCEPCTKENIITITARGDEALGEPAHMIIEAQGTATKEYDVPETSTDYELVVPESTSSIKISFTNDHYQQEPFADRNLYIEQILINNEPISLEACDISQYSYEEQGTIYFLTYGSAQCTLTTTPCETQPISETCADKCGEQKNNCGNLVNCGACETTTNETSQAYLEFMDSATIYLHADFEETQTEDYLDEADIAGAYGYAEPEYPLWYWTYALDGFQRQQGNQYDKTNICIDEGNNKYMRSINPKDMVELINTPTDTQGGGFQYWMRMPANSKVEEAYSTGLFRWHDTEGLTIYDDDHSVQTGKLPFGFVTGEIPSATTPDGKKRDWLTGCDGSICSGSSATMAFGERYDPLNTINKLKLYCYHQDMAGLYGDIRFFEDPEHPGQDYVFDNQWHSLTIYVKLNDIGSYNGIIKGYIDGRLAVEWTGLKLRHYANTYIDWTKNYFFFGGNSWEQRSYRDEYIDIDEHYVFMYKEGPMDDNLLLPNWDLTTNKPIFNGIITDNKKAP